MPTQPAILGTMRLNNVRLGYRPAALTALRATRVRILLDGVPGRVRTDGLTIHDVLNEEPNTCSLIVDGITGPAPVTGQAVRITINTDAPRLLFAGTLQTSDLTFAGGVGANLEYPCTAIDDTARFNKRRPFGTWHHVSATTIAQYLIATFAPDFTAAGVEAGLPTVSITFDGSTTCIGCLAQLASLIGGYCYVEDGVGYLFQTIATDAPDPIGPMPFPNDPPIRLSEDDSQLRTRVYGKGHSEATTVDVSVGESMLPVADAAMYNPLGGQVIVGTTPDGAASEILTYEGVQLGGGGTLVGPGAAPASAPAGAIQVGAGLAAGQYLYGFSDVTPAGESLVSPLLLMIVSGFLADPGGAPSVAATAGVGLETGVHDYAYTWQTAAGETRPTPIASVAHGPGVASPTSIGAAYIFGFGVGNLDVNATYFWGYTFRRTADGAETGLSPLTSVYTGPGGRSGLIPLAGCQAAPSGWTRVWYRTHGGTSSPLYRVPATGPTSINSGSGEATGPDAGGTFQDNVWDADLTTVVAPTGNSTDFNRSALSGIDVGPAGVTARRLWRTVAGGAQLKLLATIADNTTTTYTDTTADATLGANVPTTNTAAANQVALSGLATGVSPTTARKVYRTTVGGTQLKLLATLADNTTTTLADATPDGSLGANAPTSDGSGLVQPAGQVVAGSRSIPVAGAGAFAPSGGWAVIGNGQQIIRYSGISGNTLTGVPAIGPGAIAATVGFNSTITVAPALTGIPGNAARVTATPLTMMARIVPTTLVANAAILALVNRATDAGFYLRLDAASHARAQEYTAGVGVDSTSAGTLTAGVAAHIAGVWDGANNYCYLNGVVSPGAVALGPPAGIDAFLVGQVSAEVYGGGIYDFDGSIVEIAVWAAVLGPAEVAAIASGAVLPSAIQPGSLLVDRPLGVAAHGIPQPLAKGSPVHIWVQRDDLAAQAAAALRETNDTLISDGIHEHVLTDARRGEASLAALCDADLIRFARPIQTVRYPSRDVKTKSGKPIVIDVPELPIAATLTIQEAAISEIDQAAGTPPLYLVTASSVRFSLEHILRGLLQP